MFTFSYAVTFVKRGIMFGHLPCVISNILDVLIIIYTEGKLIAKARNLLHSHQVC